MYSAERRAVGSGWRRIALVAVAAELPGAAMHHVFAGLGDHGDIAAGIAALGGVVERSLHDKLLNTSDAGTEMFAVELVPGLLI